jgi:hypothetical protein
VTWRWRGASTRSSRQRSASAYGGRPGHHPHYRPGSTLLTSVCRL